MRRREQYRSRQRRGQAALCNVLLFLSALVVTAGLASRARHADGMTVDAVAAPTATPITAAFDETVETREIALPEQTWYALQTGIYSARDAAQQCADAYTNRGAPGLVVKEGEKYRVLIASYGQQTDAAAVRERLSREQQVDTYLYTWVCPGLTLRLSGMAGQLDIAAAGLVLAEQAAARLRDAAIGMDAGVTTRDEARALVLDIDGQMTLWADTARLRFARPYPAVLELELSLTEYWSAVCADLKQTAEDSATAFSAALKCQAMRLYAQAVSLRATLAQS